jgi:hypothetical protein
MDPKRSYGVSIGYDDPVITGLTFDEALVLATQPGEFVVKWVIPNPPYHMSGHWVIVERN